MSCFYLQGMPGFSGPPGVQGADGELVILHFYVQFVQASSRCNVMTSATSIFSLPKRVVTATHTVTAVKFVRG